MAALSFPRQSRAARGLPNPLGLPHICSAQSRVVGIPAILESIDIAAHSSRNSWREMMPGGQVVRCVIVHARLLSAVDTVAWVPRASLDVWLS
jgi:hypothetical protein